MKNKKKMVKKKSTKMNISANPFEVHVNKEKFAVLGKKQQKNCRGLPGTSRAKALEKRKYTLLQEYKGLNKSNKFIDNRIGEHNRDMSEEDKVMARFAAERIKAHNKKNDFFLVHDEVLTHQGQTLNEIEKFDDPRSEDESLDEDCSGKLDKKFIEEAHFGGGILRKTGHEGAITHKELIDQLIVESKKRKAEKQKNKEETLELTEKLDTDWKDLLPIISINKRNCEDAINKSKIDNYDKVMRELRFEARGSVSDRLKTEGEIAAEEKDQLEQLEIERLERMKGFIKDTAIKSHHKSADDLDDSFIYESDSEYMLSYNNRGESNHQMQVETNLNSVDTNEKEHENVLQEKLMENEVEKELSDEEVETDSDDNLSDLKYSSASDSEVEEKEENKNRIIQTGLERTEINNVPKDAHKEDFTLKEAMTTIKEQLPYVYTLPESYEHLQSIFQNQSGSDQSVIIERMIKCNHPSLAEGNKERLGILFVYLLQYLNDIFIDAVDAYSVENCFDIFKALAPRIYELAQINPENAHNSVLEVIKEKQDEFKKKPREYPGYEVLMFCKIVSLLFTTSDFRHQLVTPTFIFIEQMLKKCKIRNKKDISYGLFLTTLVLEYTTLSKRYLPATIVFLSRILEMVVPKNEYELVKSVHPFKSANLHLLLEKNCTLDALESFKMDCSDLVNTDIDEKYKIKVLYNTIKILEEFYNNLKDLPSNSVIFERIKRHLELIDINNYPKEIQNNLKAFINTLNKCHADQNISFLVMDIGRPKALRFYAPKIETVFDGKIRLKSKRLREKDKMLHKLKKEKKGTLREIRRDKAFLGKVKIYEKVQRDQVRREKVKQIYREGAVQQSELNKLKRKQKQKR